MKNLGNGKPFLMASLFYYLYPIHSFIKIMLANLLLAPFMVTRFFRFFSDALFSTLIKKIATHSKPKLLVK
jgi:hypothetical protein